MFCNPQQRLDADLYIVPVVLPTAFEQSGVSEPRDHVRDEDILDGDLKFRDRVLEERDVQPLAQLSPPRLFAPAASKRSPDESMFQLGQSLCGSQAGSAVRPEVPPPEGS